VDPSIVSHYLIVADVKHLMSAPPKPCDSIQFPYRRGVLKAARSRLGLTCGLLLVARLHFGFCGRIVQLFLIFYFLRISDHKNAQIWALFCPAR
jgi:hypothetical protein